MPRRRSWRFTPSSRSALISNVLRRRPRVLASAVDGDEAAAAAPRRAPPQTGRRRRRARHRSRQSTSATPAAGARRSAPATARAARAAAAASAGVSARRAGVPAPARAGRALARAGADVADRGQQPLRRRLLLLAAALLRLRPAVRARPARHGRVRNLHLLRGDAAHAARHRDLSRGRRDDDRDARRGRHAARRAGQRAPRDPVVRPLPPAAGARVPGRRGPPLLRAPGPRLPRHRARADGQPARRRRRAGRLDHHPAGREVVPDLRTDAAAEDPRGDPGAAPRAALLEARHPHALPEPDLPGPRLVRRRGGGAALLRQGGGRSRSRRDGAARRPGAGALALLAADEPGGRPRAPRSGAGHHDRGRLPDRRRGQPLARAPRRGAPAPRLLPHDVAVFRGARAPRRGAPLRREEAARGRPRDRHRGGAVDRRRRAGERRLLAAQAGQAAGLARTGRAAGGRGGGRIPRAASPRATAPTRPSRGGCTSASSRARGPAARRACGLARGSTRCRPRRCSGRCRTAPATAATASCWSRRSACCARATSSG